MSIMRCEKHGVEYDSDFIEECIECITDANMLELSMKGGIDLNAKNT